LAAGLFFSDIKKIEPLRSAAHRTRAAPLRVVTASHNLGGNDETARLRRSKAAQREKANQRHSCFSEPFKEKAMKQSEIASAIERDLLRRVDDGKSSADITKCFSCGYGMVYKGRCFCSDRCCDWYNAGNPGYAQDWLRPRKIEDTPLCDLKVTAGSPGVEIGSSYYFGERDPVTMRPTRDGYMILCVHCQVEFESKGLRCCSPRCEAQMSKPASERRQHRPKIPYYAVKVNGHGHWQPSGELRALGFKSIDLGFDGPEAWAKAKELNGIARQARKAAA
jgi:hypothetical protein